jgi:hypothetical protein
VTFPPIHALRVFKLQPSHPNADGAYHDDGGNDEKQSCAHSATGPASAFSRLVFKATIAANNAHSENPNQRRLGAEIVRRLSICKETFRKVSPVCVQPIDVIGIGNVSGCAVHKRHISFREKPLQVASVRIRKSVSRQFNIRDLRRNTH